MYLKNQKALLVFPYIQNLSCQFKNAVHIMYYYWCACLYLQDTFAGGRVCLAFRQISNVRCNSVTWTAFISPIFNFFCLMKVAIDTAIYIFTFSPFSIILSVGLLLSYFLTEAFNRKKSRCRTVTAQKCYKLQFSRNLIPFSRRVKLITMIFLFAWEAERFLFDFKCAWLPVIFTSLLCRIPEVRY